MRRKPPNLTRRRWRTKWPWARRQSSVTLDVKLLSTGSGNDNAFTVTASCGANQETLDYSVLPVQEAQQITLPLDTSRKEETISIQISREAAISQIYTIRLEKLPPVETVFQVSPPTPWFF